jgi:3-methyl-2-oxobutanoate hydroxymethyltransferase
MGTPDSASSIPSSSASSAAGEAPYGGLTRSRRTNIRDIQAFKDRGERFAMLTSYDSLTASIFQEAGIPLLLVGDSAGNNVLGYPDTLPVTVEELLPLVRAVVRGAPQTLVVADLPFGSYQQSAAQALDTAVRFVKEGGAQAVKLEGGARLAAQVRAIVEAGVPVMAHLGFTPQSVHALGGYRVQGRGEAGDVLVADAVALMKAGAFAVVLEMVPADVAERVTKELAVPTIGIGAGAACDGQVLVWPDMAGLSPEPTPRLVKKFADVRGALLGAARDYAAEVRDGVFPGPDQTYL